MLSKEQIQEAVRYNARNIGKLYSVATDLPWPWSDVNGHAFAWVTALYQMEHGLQVDGKLGKKTLEMVNKADEEPVVEIKSEKVNKNKETRTQVRFGENEKKEGLSNAVIVNGKKIKLPDEILREKITASNYMDDDEPHFKHRERKHKVVNFVLHETCGGSAKGCKNTLLRKGYGVQLILDPYGHLSCHGDLIKDRMVHANQLNNVSFGVEVVNPYNPVYVTDEALWSSTIERQWWTWVPSLKKKGNIDKGIDGLLRKKGLTNVPDRYVTPTKAQMRAIKLLVPWLCEITGVPYRFPTKGLNRKKRKIDGWNVKPKSRPGPGVVEHSSFSSHADARYILERLIAEKK